MSGVLRSGLIWNDLRVWFGRGGCYCVVWHGVGVEYTGLVEQNGLRTDLLLWVEHSRGTRLYGTEDSLGTRDVVVMKPLDRDVLWLLLDKGPEALLLLLLNIAHRLFVLRGGVRSLQAVCD